VSRSRPSPVAREPVVERPAAPASAVVTAARFVVDAAQPGPRPA